MLSPKRNGIDYSGFFHCLMECCEAELTMKFKTVNRIKISTGMITIKRQREVRELIGLYKTRGAGHRVSKGMGNLWNYIVAPWSQEITYNSNPIIPNIKETISLLDTVVKFVKRRSSVQFAFDSCYYSYLISANNSNMLVYTCVKPHFWIADSSCWRETHSTLRLRRKYQLRILTIPTRKIRGGDHLKLKKWTAGQNLKL